MYEVPWPASNEGSQEGLPAILGMYWNSWTGICAYNCMKAILAASVASAIPIPTIPSTWLSSAEPLDSAMSNMDMLSCMTAISPMATLPPFPQVPFEPSLLGGALSPDVFGGVSSDLSFMDTTLDFNFNVDLPCDALTASMVIEDGIITINDIAQQLNGGASDPSTLANIFMDPSLLEPAFSSTLMTASSVDGIGEISPASLEQSGAIDNNIDNLLMTALIELFKTAKLVSFDFCCLRSYY